MKLCTMRRGTSWLALATAFGAMSVAGAALAQDAEGGNTVEEVVVTAQFREQNLQDTPIAITAVNGDMLRARSQTDISQVANQAPNVTLKPQGQAFGPSLAASIRGIGQYDFNPALEPGVGLYVDDVYYPTLTGAIFDLLDVDRVEVLRGPQGTLAGRNSIGGAVKLYSKRPTGDGSGFLSAAYGSRDRVDLRAGADFKLAEGLFFRLAGVSKSQDGYIDRLDFGCVNKPGSALNPAVGGVAAQVTGTNCKVADDSEVGYQAVRGQLRYQPNDRVDINIIADYTLEEHNATGAVLTFASNANPNVRGTAPNVPYDSRFICGKYCNYANYYSPAGLFALGPANLPVHETRYAGDTRFEGWGVSGQLDWDLTDNLQLVSITSYRDYHLAYSNDDDLSPLAIGNGQGDLTFWGFSQEVRLNGEAMAGKLEYTLGAYYGDQKSVYATFQDIRYAPIPLQFQGDDPIPATSKAVFAHAAWHATDQLTLTGGLRYTEEEKDYTFTRRNKDGTLNPFLGALDGVTGHYEGDRVDWRINASYEFTDALMAYAQFSTGFKGGGIGPRPFNPAQVQPFGPETLDTYEVGVKSDLFDRRLRLNLAAFHNKYDDIQLTLLSCPQFGGPGPCALPSNAGDATMNGFEAEASLRPAAGFLIDASLSYIDFEYDRINAAAGGAGGVQPDMVPPFMPKWKWAIGAQYEFDLGDTAGTLTPRLDVSFQDDIFSNAVNTSLNHISNYTLANARLTWRNADKDLEISGEVTNLFDKYYYLTTFDLTGAGAGFANAQPGRPREWAVSITKRF